MKKLAMVCILCASTAAGAVPSTINFTGRLTTFAGPVNGAINLTLKLYDVASGGSALWTEVHSNVGADNGLVFVDAGALAPLNETILDGRRLYLEVAVGSETLTPRLAINSVPYAVRAAVATNSERLGPSIGPGDVVTSVNGSNGVTAVKAGNAVALSLSTTGCTSGQVFKYNGTAFACGPDADTTYTAGNGVSVAGTTIGLSTTGCAPGFVWKYNGTAFACGPDADTTYTAGNGISVTGTSISINSAVVPQLAGTNSFSGVSNFPNTGNSFTGSGAGLFGLNANNFGSGTIPSAQVSGAYPGITTVGPLGSLKVTGAIARGSTGAANMVPIAYGNVNADGTINGGSTPNFTVTKSSNAFSIAITGETYTALNYVTTASMLLLSICAVPVISSLNGQLIVTFFSCTSPPLATSVPFTFVTYRP